MRRVGQTRRRDANEKAIVDALEAAGAYVVRVSGVGAPDLFVRHRGQWYAMEVKSSSGQLTPAQRLSIQRGSRPFEVVRSVDEALDVLAIKWRP